MHTIMPISTADTRDHLGNIAEPSSCRIASLLPGLTDVLRDLVLEDYVVAHSHECDLTAVSVTRPKLPGSSALSSSEIDAGWKASNITHPMIFSHSPETILSTRLCSFYHVNICTLAQTKPILLLTHFAKPRFPDDIDESRLRKLAKALIPSLRIIISVNCQTLHEVFQLHRDVARGLGQPDLAVNPVALARGRLESIRGYVNSYFRETKEQPPRVAIVQWAEPLFLAGDWVPGVVKIAGGKSDGVTMEGGPSVGVIPEDLKDIDIVIFAICAVDIEGCRKIVEIFWKNAAIRLRGWHGRIILTDATRLFSRVAVGSVVESAEVLAEVLTRRAYYGHRTVLWGDWEIPGGQERRSTHQQNDDNMPFSLPE